MRLPSCGIAADSRTAAWIAITQSIREQSYIDQTLDRWAATCSPTPADLALARELASGTVRHQLTLDYFLGQVTYRGLNSLGSEEISLLRMMAYQLAFLERVPPYAAVDQSVRIARRFGHPSFARFVNAVGRKLVTDRTSPPADNLSLALSYPSWFIEQLLKQFSKQTVVEVLSASNQSPRGMARRRPGSAMLMLDGGPIPQEITHSPEFYIQNVTPVDLLDGALQHIPAPSRVLDLCAAPGGKTLLVHDRFPEAELHLNDISASKCERLRENLRKYAINACVTAHSGETYTSDRGFDLVVVDAPCTNSGVLAKRAEARWRLDDSRLAPLVQLQRALLTRAAALLNPGGYLCYMTCSILASENEGQVQWASEHLSMRSVHSQLQIPTADHRDGGFVGLLN